MPALETQVTPSSTAWHLRVLRAVATRLPPPVRRVIARLNAARDRLSRLAAERLHLRAGGTIRGEASSSTTSGVIDRDNYWGRRKDAAMYALVKFLARVYVPHGGAVLDVGCFTSMFVLELDWFRKKAVADSIPYLVDNWKGAANQVEFHAGDFMTLRFPESFDLVVCLQVVEHLEEPAPFIRKMMDIGRTVIVTTTYEVPHGIIDGHVQDPISIEKFKGWFGRDLEMLTIATFPGDPFATILGVVTQK